MTKNTTITCNKNNIQMTVISTIESQNKPNSKSPSKEKTRKLRRSDGENTIIRSEPEISSPLDDSHECFLFGENQESQNQEADERKANEPESNEASTLRAFRFNIQNDANLQSIMNNNLNADGSNPHELFFNNFDTETDVLLTDNISELTSDYILSKLYNYMKISEMSKYGISVFEMTFSSYLPYLSESDLIKLASSYWCNGQHFNCMIARRGEEIKSNSTLLDDQCTLQLEISADLLDSAMQSGASVDKIEAMLFQKRIDKGIHTKYDRNYHTKYERSFYLRNLKHRFWNHEVLVRVFIQNGWLTPNLADIAMKTFIKTVYHRVLQSKCSLADKHCKRGRRNVGGIKFSENFLHSFFVSYFCLDDIPKMYKKEISQIKSKNPGENYINHISEETLRRWCELIELLASRGANINEYEFRKIIPLQYALKLGKQTYKIIASSHKSKNLQLIPQSYHQENIYIPDDVWNILVSYL